MKKQILLLFFPLLAFVFHFSVYAEDDCPYTKPSAISNLADFSSRFSSADLELARKHLLAYCCIEHPTLEWCWDSTLPAIFPESPYRYDQIVDIGIRKLNGDPLDAYPEQSELDKDAQDRNTFIFQQKDPTKTLIPLAITEKYKQYRTLHAADLQTDFQTNMDSSSHSLRYKYLNWCRVAQAISKKITDKEVESTYVDSCSSLLQQQIEKQTLLTKTLLVHYASRTLGNSLKSYALDEFIQNRLMKIMGKFTSILQLFTKISTQAPLSPQCTK